MKIFVNNIYYYLHTSPRFLSDAITTWSLSLATQQSLTNDCKLKLTLHRQNDVLRTIPISHDIQLINKRALFLFYHSFRKYYLGHYAFYINGFFLGEEREFSKRFKPWLYTEEFQNILKDFYNMFNDVDNLLFVKFN